MKSLTPLQLGKRAGRVLIGAMVVNVICSFLTACVAIYIYPSYIYPIWRSHVKSPVDSKQRFQRVDFLSVDGIRLAGWYGAGAGGRATATIIVCHGWASDKADMLGFAQVLRASGFNVLLFDLHGWGESDRGPVTFGDRETGDVLGAVRFLKEQRPGETQRIGLIGFSMGAAAAIRAAAQSSDIDAVVADASYARLDVQVGRFFQRFTGPLWPIAYVPARWFGEWLTGTALGSISPLQAIGQISPRPVLIIHGTRDQVISVQDARRLYQAAGPRKSLWLVEGAGHGETRRVRSAEYDARVVGYFREHLLRATAAASHRPRTEEPSQTFRTQKLLNVNEAADFLHIRPNRIYEISH
jgi:fermentation-respiration switch protein FrsA (DUF1100 family)